MDKYTFGKNLYELRNKKGLTQKELGKLLGVSDKAVSKWETGEAMPRTAKLVLITDLFGVTMERLSSEDFDCNAEDFQINETAEEKENRYKKYFDNAMKQYYRVSKGGLIVSGAALILAGIFLIGTVIMGGTAGVASSLWKLALVYLLPIFILLYGVIITKKIYDNREKTILSDFSPALITLMVFSIVYAVMGFAEDITKNDIVNAVGCLITCLGLIAQLKIINPGYKKKITETKTLIIVLFIGFGILISCVSNISNDIVVFTYLAELCLVLSVLVLSCGAIIIKALRENDSGKEEQNKSKKKIFKKALITIVALFVVVSVAFTLFPGLAYKIHCQNMQKGQEINTQWETKDISFKKGESKRISMDWFSVAIPKELKKTDFESSLDNTTLDMYKDEDIAVVSIQRVTDNPYADFNLFEISGDASEEEKAVDELYLLNFQKYFGFIPQNMYEYQRLAASLDADDMKVYDYLQCVLYTQLITTAQMLSFGGSNEVYYVDTDRTYGEITVIPPLSEEYGRLMATYSVVDKYNLDVDYRVIISIPNNDRNLLHKIINSVEFDL